jgi:2-dehydro-3-deoxygluconokinase
MIEVLTLGECMAVLYPDEPVKLENAPRVLLNIAGAEANFAIGMSRLGHRVRYISRVGDDPFGLRIRQTLAEEGVDVTYLMTDPSAPTGVFFREWLPDGARRVYYYRTGSAASQMIPDDLSPSIFTGTRLVHLTGITPALSPGCKETVARAFELARQSRATISFDPNYRARLWEAAEARKTLLPFIARADILLMGHEDSQALLGTEADNALDQVAGLGPKIVVLKQAERGATALADGVRTHIPAYPVDAVIDPVGAGDGFDAGFLSAWLRDQSIEDALRLGARIGAAAVSALGDYGGFPRQI